MKPDAAKYILRMLGGFDLSRADGAPVELPTRKTRLLLALLAAPAGQSHTRESLAALLWGDTRDEQARGSLRHALAALRARLGHDLIEADHDHVALATGYIDTDTDRLARAAGKAADIATLNADGLYGGEFLAGHAIAGQEFSDWLLFERTRCRNLAETAFERIITFLQTKGRYEEAIPLAHRLITFDPLREQSHRLLIGLLYGAGERAKALAQFNALKTLLDRELGVGPSPQTLALVRQTLADEPAAGKDQSSLHRTPATGPANGPRSGIKFPGAISLAVLPFANLSESADDRYAVQGFSEDLVTELSRLPELFVIARQSSDGFPSASRTAATAANDLGVRYVVAGSFRRSAGRLRISAQLIDGTKDRCLWAERYDRPFAETFAIEDDIVAQIAGNLDAEIHRAERERAAGHVDEMSGAWELTHRGFWHAYKFTPADADAAEDWFRRAIEVSPDYAMAFAGLCYTAYVRAVFRFSSDLPALAREGVRCGTRATELDPANAFAHIVLGRHLLTLLGNLPEAFDHFRRGVEINPSFAQGHYSLAQAHIWAGQAQKALPHLELALRLSPKDPLLSMFLTMQALGHFSLGNYESAEASARRAVQVQPKEAWARLALASTLMVSGRQGEAHAAVEACRVVAPYLSMTAVEPLIRHATPRLRDPLLAALREAGLS